MLVNGQVATYRLVVTNAGPAATFDPIVVVDDLPAGLSFVSAEGSGWVCNATGQRVECAFSASLPVSQSASIALVVDVNAEAGASITNSATVDGGVAVSGDGDDTTDTVQAAPDLPRTGSDGLAALRLAAMILLAGIGLMLIARWRRQRNVLTVS